jgi:hypothetical protein
VANALNHATKTATGDIVHYLHSDDYYNTDDALERAARYFRENPELVWLTGNFLVEIRNRKIALPQTHLLRINPGKALSAMNIISHENTFMKLEAVEKYGGFSEGKDDVVEYKLWLNLIKDHQPRIVDEEFTVFIIHSGSTSTGSVIKFSKAILRAFKTQRKEKIFPLIGYYEEKEFYKKYKRLVDKAAEIRSLIDLNNT